MALQISINSTTSTRLSPPSYLATNDCGRRRRLASSCWVRPAVLRAPIINSQKAACPAEWTDLSSLRARVAIGAEADPMIGLSQNGIYFNPVAVFCGRRWTCRAKEANCRQDQSEDSQMTDRQLA